MNSYGMSEDEKRKEIETDLSLNMFVEAGAGAGKTTLIVRRIVNMLKNGYEPSEIVAITFTNKAAEELRSRIQKEAGSAASASDTLSDKLYRLDEMNISTIHSFCSVLLKEQGGAAGLPQDLVLIQDNEEKELKRKYLNDYLRTLTQADWQQIEADKDRDWIESRRNIKEYIEELFMSICDLPPEVDIVTPRDPASAAGIKQKTERLIMGDASASVSGIADLIAEAASLCFDHDKNTGDKEETISDPDELLKAAGGKLASAKTVKIINEIKKGASCDRNIVIKALLSKNKYLNVAGLPVRYDKNKVDQANIALEDYIDEKLGPAKVWTDLGGKTTKDRLGNKIILTFYDSLDNGIRKEKHFQTLVSYAKKAREYYHDNRPSNMITNDDLLRLTRDLIRDSRAARDHFRNKYRTFFVDEFQDTDSLQADFIYRLAEDAGDESRLRPGALFVVGDPKQSIYRFRGAEPEIYFHIKENLEKLDNAKTYELSKNFRSNKDVIDWINKKFTESDKHYHIVNSDSYTYRDMEQVNKTASAGKGTLLSGIYRYDNPDNEIKAGNDSYVYTVCDTEEDVDDMIRVITELTSKDEDGAPKFLITRYKKEDGVFKEYADGIKLSDFLLISPDTIKMNEYVSALKSHAIPVVIDGKVSLKADKALNVYSRVYRYLVNPRSPFYRVAALEAIRESSDTDSEEEFESYADDVLDCLYEDCRHMTPYGKAYYLERQTSVIFDKEKDISSIDMHTVRTHIRQMLESINVNINGTGEDIIGKMDRYIEAGLEHELSLEEAPEAVRFMNLHKAKGLEGNIVILLDRRGREVSAPCCLRVGNTFYPGIENKYGRGWSSLSGIESLEKKYKDDEASEFHRLEYVAITRAKQAAIFMDVISTSSARYKRRLFAQCRLEGGKKISYSYEIKDCNRIFDAGSVKLPEISKPQPVNYTVSADDYPETHEEGIKEPVSFIKINPSGLEKKISAAKKKAVLDAEASGRKREEEYSSTLPRPVGNLPGDALHNTMELVVNGLMKDRTRDIERLVSYCAGRAVMNLEASLGEENPVERDKYVSFIKACAKAYVRWLLDDTGEGSVLQNAETAYTEFPFSYSVDNNGRKEWHNGSADLILKNKDGSFTLIDYKSDNDYLVPEDIMHESLVEKYSPQLEEYRNVIMKLFGVSSDKIRTGIISFSQKDETGNLLAGEEVRVRYTKVSP